MLALNLFGTKEIIVYIVVIILIIIGITWMSMRSRRGI